jgi:hypothetical protein
MAVATIIMCARSIPVPSLFETRLGTVVAVNTPLALAVAVVVMPLSATFALANRRDQVCGFRSAVLSMAVWVVQAVTSPVAMATALVLVGGAAPESLFIGAGAKQIDRIWPGLKVPAVPQRRAAHRFIPLSRAALWFDLALLPRVT